VRRHLVADGLLLQKPDDRATFHLGRFLLFDGSRDAAADPGDPAIQEICVIADRVRNGPG
jgi:hypothetical protein